MIQGILTGSRVYGVPDKHADIDLVLLVSKADYERLCKAANDHHKGIGQEVREHKDEYGIGPASVLYFGGMNVIATTDPVAFGVWVKGTEELKRKALDKEGDASGGRVSRDEAVSLFRKLRKLAGVGK